MGMMNDFSHSNWQKKLMHKLDTINTNPKSPWLLTTSTPHFLTIFPPHVNLTLLKTNSKNAHFLIPKKALEDINKNYHIHQHTYTDGSKQSTGTRIGASAHIPTYTHMHKLHSSSPFQFLMNPSSTPGLISHGGIQIPSLG